MPRLLKWLAFGLAAFVLLAIGVVLALQQWLRTDDFRGRIEREAAATLGVPMKVGSLSVDLWPLPALAVDQVRLQTQPPLTVGRVEARPVWTALLLGRLEIDTLVVREAVLPQSAIGAVGAALQKKRKVAARRGAAAPAASASPAWPRRALLEDITWTDGKGRPMTMEAKARLGSDGLLDQASFKVLRGRFAGARGQIERAPDHWPVRLDIGGGRISGKLQLEPAGKGAQLLQGQFRTENVEVAALTAPSRSLSGKLQAQTTLRSEFREAGQAMDALQTQTRFTVRDAVVQGIDLAKAVQTAGLSRGGVTQLDTLTGQVSTSGKTVHMTHLVATSGALAASGKVSISPSRALSGRITVDLQTTGGAIGVPLAVGGTVDAPSVMLTRGAMVGAAIGTLIAPGAGTAAGAAAGDRIGNTLKGLFGR